MPIPDHVRKAMLTRNYEALRQMGRRGAMARKAKATTKYGTPKKEETPIRDGKAAAYGND